MPAQKSMQWLLFHGQAFTIIFSVTTKMNVACARTCACIAIEFGVVPVQYLYLQTPPLSGWSNWNRLIAGNAQDSFHSAC